MLCNITLFNATTKGVFFFRSKFRDSIVCGSKPCMMSTTRIAISHNVEPRDRKLLHKNTSTITGHSREEVHG